MKYNVNIPRGANMEKGDALHSAGSPGRGPDPDLEIRGPPVIQTLR